MSADETEPQLLGIQPIVCCIGWAGAEILTRIRERDEDAPDK